VSQRLLDPGPTPVLAGPASLLGLSQLSAGLNLLRQPIPFLLATERRYGPLSGVSRSRPRLVFAFGPEQTRQVLTGRVFLSDAFRHLRLPPGSPMMLLTSGLLRLNGGPHRRHRQAMQSSFSPHHVHVYSDTIVRHTDEVLDEWHPGERIDLFEEMTRLTSRIAVSTIAGIEDRAAADHLNGLTLKLRDTVANPLTVILQKPWPGTPFARMTRIAAEIEKTLRSLIAQRRDAGREPDLLSRLAVPEAETDTRLADDEVVSEAYTALCHDSVAASLVWTLVLLDQHREWWGKLRAEAAEVAGDTAPTSGVLSRMPVLDHVIKESMRLMPPATFLVRYADHGAYLDGHSIPHGAMVVVSPFVTHRNDALFPEPLRFRPDRWESQRPAQHAYFPFGLGPHNCIGGHLAFLEIKLVLTRIMQRAPVALPAGSVIDPAVRISMVPAGPLQGIVVAPAGTAPPIARVTGSINEIVTLP
jgi:cytochrome P450